MVIGVVIKLLLAYGKWCVYWNDVYQVSAHTQLNSLGEKRNLTREYVEALDFKDIYLVNQDNLRQFNVHDNDLNAGDNELSIGTSNIAVSCSVTTTKHTTSSSFVHNSNSLQKKQESSNEIINHKERAR